MALLQRGWSRCPICGSVLTSGEGLFATSGVAFPDTDPLFRFCDAAMHWRCYEQWPERTRFARAYFRMWRDAAAKNHHWGIVWADDDVLLTVNPRPPVEKADVLLAATGTNMRVAVRDWESWIGGGAVAGETRILVRRALADVLPRLRSVASSIDALKERAVFPPPPPARIPSRSEELAGLRRFNRKARQRAKGAADLGLRCPHCGSERRDHRFSDLSSHPGRSFFTCAACSRSFSHEDT